MKPILVLGRRPGFVAGSPARARAWGLPSFTESSWTTAEPSRWIVRRRGTRFRVYLPVIGKESSSLPSDPRNKPVGAGLFRPMGLFSYASTVIRRGLEFLDGEIPVDIVGFQGFLEPFGELVVGLWVIFFLHVARFFGYLLSPECLWLFMCAMHYSQPR